MADAMISVQRDTAPHQVVGGTTMPAQFIMSKFWVALANES